MTVLSGYDFKRKYCYSGINFFGFPKYDNNKCIVLLNNKLIPTNNIYFTFINNINEHIDENCEYYSFIEIHDDIVIAILSDTCFVIHNIEDNFKKFKLSEIYSLREYINDNIDLFKNKSNMIRFINNENIHKIENGNLLKYISYINGAKMSLINVIKSHDEKNIIDLLLYCIDNDHDLNLSINNMSMLEYSCKYLTSNVIKLICEFLNNDKKELYIIHDDNYNVNNTLIDLINNNDNITNKFKVINYIKPHYACLNDYMKNPKFVNNITYLINEYFYVKILSNEHLLDNFQDENIRKLILSKYDEHDIIIDEIDE